VAGAAVARAVSGWPMESPVAGSKKCSRLVSTASWSAAPGRTRDRDDTRAVHRDFPPTSAVTVSSSSSCPPAALVIEACSTGGASIAKIAWISVPSPSVTPVVTSIRGQDASANEPSSKSDGRMPRTTLRPK
jgi:hypothetical protein